MRSLNGLIAIVVMTLFFFIVFVPSVRKMSFQTSSPRPVNGVNTKPNTITKPAVVGHQNDTVDEEEEEKSSKSVGIWVVVTIGIVVLLTLIILAVIVSVLRYCCLFYFVIADTLKILLWSPKMSMVKLLVFLSASLLVL